MPALVNGTGGGSGNVGSAGGGPFGSSHRRGPIAAEFQGPGPAAVALPSTIGTSSSHDELLALHLAHQRLDFHWLIKTRRYRRCAATTPRRTLPHDAEICAAVHKGGGGEMCAVRGPSTCESRNPALFSSSTRDSLSLSFVFFYFSVSRLELPGNECPRLGRDK